MGEAVTRTMLVLHPPNAATGRMPVLRFGGFSLLEIMIAVSLLALIIVGLMAMFFQTQKAFRLGTRQADVLEGGRGLMEMLTRELQEVAGTRDSINFYANSGYMPLIQPRSGAFQTNVLEEYFFITKSNDWWTGIAYLIDARVVKGFGTVGSLYRYSTNSPTIPEGAVRNLFITYQDEMDNYEKGRSNSFRRVADQVIHLKLSPYNSRGVLYTNYAGLTFPLTYSFTNEFTRDPVPAFIDLELGVLEPRAAERFRAIADDAKAYEFITNQVDKVHLFRQRIALRSLQ